jgi:hypothetical protein
VLVPETLLKKRKSQEKARAERTAALEKKQAVRIIPLIFPFLLWCTTHHQLDNVDAVDQLTFFRVWQSLTFHAYYAIIWWPWLTIAQASKEKRSVIFKRAEKYVSEYRSAEREKIRLSRAAKADDAAYIPAEAKLIFVVRIKGYVCESHLELNHH